MIADAGGGYFEPKQRPKRIRLHFSTGPDTRPLHKAPHCIFRCFRAK